MIAAFKQLRVAPRLRELESELDWCWREMDDDEGSYVRARRAYTVDAPHAHAMLRPFTAVCVWSFFVAEQSTTCFVLHGSEPIQVVTLPLGRKEVEDALASVRVAFNGDLTGLFPLLPINPDAPGLVDPQLASFRSVCAALAPLERYLAGPELVIAPHGPLHAFPFAAVELSDGRQLGAAVPITYVSSLSVLSLTLNRRDDRADHRHVEALSVTAADDPEMAGGGRRPPPINAARARPPPGRAPPPDELFPAAADVARTLGAFRIEAGSTGRAHHRGRPAPHLPWRR